MKQTLGFLAFVGLLAAALCAADVNINPGRLFLSGPFDRTYDTFTSSESVTNVAIPFDGSPVKVVVIGATNATTVTLNKTGYVPTDSSRTIHVLVQNQNASTLSWALDTGSILWGSATTVSTTNAIFTFTATAAGVFGHN